MLNKITLALLLTPALAFSAAQKPKLVRPTIVHAPRTAVMNKLDEFPFCMNDERRIEFLNDFFTYQKQNLTEAERGQLCEILAKLRAANDPIIPRLKISPEWRNYLAKFENRMKNVFDAIDDAQPKKVVTAAAEHPGNRWVTVIQEVSERYAKENSIDCISRADVEDALVQITEMNLPAIIHTADALRSNSAEFTPVVLQFMYCLLARAYSHKMNSAEAHASIATNPHQINNVDIIYGNNYHDDKRENLLEQFIPPTYAREARRFLKEIREPKDKAWSKPYYPHFTDQYYLARFVTASQCLPIFPQQPIANLVAAYATNYGGTCLKPYTKGTPPGDTSAYAREDINCHSCGSTDFQEVIDWLTPFNYPRYTVKYISARNNCITEITSKPNGNGPHADTVIKIDLADNDISAIPAYAFTAFTRLLDLDLSNNRIETIAESAFLPSLQYLRLHGNRLSETERSKLRNWWQNVAKKPLYRLELD